MIKSKDCVLLDANILVYADQEADEHHVASKALRDQGLHGEVSLCVCPQVLNEYFAVVTNARRVSNPRTSETARREVMKYIKSQNFLKIYPTPTTLNRLYGLLQKHLVSGPLIFDYYLIATMLENDIKKVYTYNTNDFSPVSEIQVLAPPFSNVPEPEKPENS